MENPIVRRRIVPNQIINPNERNVVMNENVNPVYPTYFDLGNEPNLSANNGKPPVSQHAHDDGIEVIDLDNQRDQIKPTTWHN